MSKGRFEDEYKWAQAHSETTEGKSLLSFAQMYTNHADYIVYGLIEGVCADIRKKYFDKGKQKT
jgi:hypothetical protein